MENNSNIPPENFELIEASLLGNLQPEEQEQFSKRLETDPDLKARYEELRLISLAIQEASLRDRLETFHGSIKQEESEPLNTVAKVRSINWQRWVSAAAVIVVLIGAWFVFNQPSAEQKIFASYYKPDPGLVTTMGGTEEYDFNHAMISYKSGKYDEAIKEWKKMLTANPSGDTLNYFIGSSYMAIGNAKLAVQHFELVLKNEKSVFLSDAYWYTALSYIRLGNREYALQYLGLSNHKDKQALITEYSK